MAPPASSPSLNGERDLLGQTVLVIGGSSGIGLETARLARAHGADIILTARDPDGLPAQVPLAVHGRGVDRGGHGSSRRRRSRRQFRPGRLRCHVCGLPAGPVRVALVMPGTTFALRRVRRPRETPWADPVVCGVPRARPQIYALLIPAASSRR